MASVEMIEIQEGGSDLLARYAQVPIRFAVESMLRVEPVGRGLGGLVMVEEKIARPYVKDYDSQGPDAGPLRWPRYFDVSRWRFFLAVDMEKEGRPWGGATLALDTPGVTMLEGRRDLAVLWDIRVHPDVRGRGIGARLFQRAVDRARQLGYKQFKVETQNVNVAACRFYAAQGCTLGAIHRYAYAAFPTVAHEAMLLWYLEL